MSKKDSALAILESGLDLITRGWCQNDYAKSAKGLSRKPSDKSARSWCAVGALDCAAQRLNHELYSPAHSAALGCLHTCNNKAPLAEWNDDPSRTKKDVVLLYKSAVEQLKGGL